MTDDASVTSRVLKRNNSNAMTTDSPPSRSNKALREVRVAAPSLPLPKEENGSITMIPEQDRKPAASSSQTRPVPALSPLQVSPHNNNNNNNSSTSVSMSANNDNANNNDNHHEDQWAEFSDVFQETIGKPGRKALRKFFYPHPHRLPNPDFLPATDAAEPAHAQASAGAAAAAAAAAAATTGSAAVWTTEERDSSTSGATRSATTTTIHSEPQPQSQPQNPAAHEQEQIANLQQTIKRQASPPHVKTPPPPPPKNPPPPNNNTTTPANSQQRQSPLPPLTTTSEQDDDLELLEQERNDREYVDQFWTAYDDILILALFTQLGILCRLGAAYSFRFFDSVFRHDSALFVNLPLNCLSCFVMGMFCSGESLMEIIHTRFTPPRLQQEIQQQQLAEDYYDNNNDAQSWEDLELVVPQQQQHPSPPLRRRGQRQRRRLQGRRASVLRRPGSQQPPAQDSNTILQDELREVQLLALERRIRASPCLVLFPVKKEDVDVVEDHLNDGGFLSRSSKSNADQAAASKRHRSPQEEVLKEQERSRRFSLDDNDSELFVEDGFDDLILQEEGPEPLRQEGMEPHTLPRHVMFTGTAGKASLNAPAAAAAAAAGTFPLPPRAAVTTTPTTALAPSTPTQTVVAPLPNSRSKLLRTPNQQQQPNAATTRVEEEGKVEEVAHMADEDQTPTTQQGRVHAHTIPHVRNLNYAQVNGGNVIDYGGADLDQIITTVATGVTQKISRISRVNLADGWDVGTTPEEKSADLMLGLRAGLCGALSSFSSWISDMVGLFRGGQFGQAIVGLLLGIQLPIVAYRFGQHVAVYLFIWRCRRETRRDEQRGYGIRIRMDEDDEWDDNNSDPSVGDLSGDLPAGASHRSNNNTRTKGGRRAVTVQEEEGDDETPSVRAIITALFMLSLVGQITSLNFFQESEDRLISLSLLFSPLGVLARWRLCKYNTWRPNFPIGTFTCNIAACALSGTLGSLLAGNPGQSERIALVAVIAGFAGTLSSVALFIVEILAGTDPILFRMDGMYYAFSTVFWGLLVSFLFAASVDWADDVGNKNQ
jgi:fluoride ion exporter CrcB/FEX